MATHKYSTYAPLSEEELNTMVLEHEEDLRLLHIDLKNAVRESRRRFLKNQIRIVEGWLKLTRRCIDNREDNSN